MTKKEELVWRLSEKPSADVIGRLVEKDVITKDEARTLLFSQDEPKKVQELQEEIKFLRELVDKLTDQKNVQIVREVYNKWTPTYTHWYQGYGTVINTVPYTYVTGSINNTATGSLAVASGTVTNASTALPKFSSLN